MAAHSIKTAQKIPVSLKDAWNFFSSPANLQAITPGNMGFKIISKHHGEKMYTGQVIEYKVSPILNIPMLLDDRDHTCGGVKVFYRYAAKGAL